MKEIRLGLVMTDGDRAVRSTVAQIPVVSVVAEIEGFCEDASAAAVRKLAAAQPDVVLIAGAADRARLIGTLRALQGVVPEAKLFVNLAVADSQVIIEAMRAGAGEFLESPVSAADLEQALGRHLAQSAPVDAKRNAGHLYSVIAGKLSSGATTVAINVADVIAAATATSTLLVDMDMPLGDAAAYLNLRPQYTVQDALAASGRLDSTLLENFTVRVKNSTLNVLGGFRDYTVRSAVTPSALEALLRMARQTFRHTVVDLSGSMDEDQAVVVARQSAQVLIVLTPDLPAIWRTEKLLTFLSHHGAADNVKLILNRTSRRDDIGERDIERLLSHPVYHSLPNDYGACLKAINSGRPLQQEDSRPLYLAIQDLAFQMAGIQKTREKGLLGMFLRPSSIGG